MEPAAGADTQRYVLSLSGINRLGALAAVSQALADLGGNAFEVRQTVVGKFFNVLLSSDFPASQTPEVIVAHVTDACRPFHVQLNIFDANLKTAGQEATPGGHPLRLIIRGPDQPGTLRLISARLAQCGVDVVDVFAARPENTARFELRLRIALPPATDRSALESVLDELGEQLVWELQEID